MERLTYPEHEEGYIMWSSSLLRPETFLQETVEKYEEARERFGASEGLTIHQFLSQVDYRIRLWRLDGTTSDLRMLMRGARIRSRDPLPTRAWKYMRQESRKR